MNPWSTKLLVRRILVVAASVLAISSALAGEITLFENPAFSGRRIVLTSSVANFDRGSFNDRASSMIVGSGYWEVCTDARFQGRCTRFGPGRYESLGGLNDSISSVREVAGPAPGGGGPIAGGGGPRIQLFEVRNFGGRSITLTTDASDLERRGFNDRADAAVVRGGVWRLCTDARMQGNCRDFPPGRYNDLGPLGGKVSSAMIVR